MIIKREYEDIGIAKINTNYNKKIKTHYIRYIVDEYCIEKAIKEAEENKWVVALDYEGDIQYLFRIKEKPKKPVIVTKEFVEISELSIDFFMSYVPSWVTVVIKTPKDYSDMRMIEKLSKKYENIRFCGGKFLRLPGCRIGCIQRDEIPTKIADSKIHYYTEGCACAMETMNSEDVEGLDILYKGREEKQLEPVLEEPSIKVTENKNAPINQNKKVVNSLEDLLNM